MVAEKYANQIKRIKNNVEKSYTYFQGNYQRYNDFKKFTFYTQLSDEDTALLSQLQKPAIEFNILNTYVSRLCGEFSKQEPSIKVSMNYGKPIDPDMIELVEGHMRHILCEAANNSTQYCAFRDCLGGGFSVFKVWTEYENERSMDQVIRFERVFEPTLCGFDPMARTPHKGDGEYCFENFPRTKEQFEHEYPNVDISELRFIRDAPEGFNWTYRSEKEDIIMVCDYYEKKKKKVKLYKLANGATVTKDEYEEHLERWNQEGHIEQPPAIVAERKTDLEIVCRYRLIGNQIIEYSETNFRYLPLVFVDGDSVYIRNGVGSAFEQITRPYVFHAHGAQRLKNFAGQTLANEIENMVMHKFKVAKEALPTEEDYLEAYTNVQQANVLVYNAFMDNDPEKPIPAGVQEVQRIPTPPEITNAFVGADQMVQGILGNYDAALGINDNELSGVAIVEGATQSNAAAMPYVVNYMHSLNQVAQIFLDLFPKYITTKRTIPIMKLDGRRAYIDINEPNKLNMHYDAGALNVKVEAGVNFAVQKNRALMQITAMMQASPLFAQFMNTEGLDFLLDNMEFRGVDALKVRADQWMQQMKQMQAQQAQQPNPDQMYLQLEQQKIQMKGQEMQQDAQLKAQELMINKAKVDNDRLNVMLKAGQSQNELAAGLIKAKAEEKRADADLRLKHLDVGAKHAHNHAKLQHDMTKSRKE